ncbi:DUF547 domain-containing protein [Halobacteria archaeon AArc-curdl1]|uniref:DUF547 domain-containing protein n=1 Tax=Natronosalvus hydrolyticus TaxID=2979988 RepID=A0AAP2Z5E1_9EURY|nr:DUF547 domain-containing protein [Halobacteria archaeon AArc-curdl1]
MTESPSYVLESGSPAGISRALLNAVRVETPVDGHLEALARASHDDLEPIRADEETGLAFWLNLYNAATQLLLEERPGLFESRIRFFRAAAITVAGVDLSLDDIEHGIIRGRKSKYGLGYLPRLEPTGLPAGYQLGRDPRIHFALNCGAASCPAIRFYEPETIDSTLEEATRTSLESTVEYDADRNRVVVPRVCLWFLGDFGGRSGIRSLLAAHELIPPDSSPKLRFASYDWTKARRMFLE